MSSYKFMHVDQKYEVVEGALNTSIRGVDHCPDISQLVSAACAEILRLAGVIAAVWDNTQKPLLEEIRVQRERAEEAESRVDDLVAKNAVLQDRLERREAQVEEYIPIGRLLGVHGKDGEAPIDTLRRVIRERDEAIEKTALDGLELSLYRFGPDQDLRGEIRKARLDHAAIANALESLLEFVKREPGESASTGPPFDEIVEIDDDGTVRAVGRELAPNQRAASLLALLDSEQPPQGLERSMNVNSRLPASSGYWHNAALLAWRWLREQAGKASGE